MKVLHTNMLQSRTRGKQPGGCQRVPQQRRSAQREEDKRTDQEFTIRDSNQCNQLASFPGPSVPKPVSGEKFTRMGLER